MDQYVSKKSEVDNSAEHSKDLASDKDTLGKAKYTPSSYKEGGQTWGGGYNKQN